jgi:hypothetical protein
MPDSLETIAPLGNAWPKPDRGLLEESRPDLPDFPLHALPPWWRAWISETAQAVGAPVDYVVQALLAAVAGVGGAGVVARLSEAWDEPLILWQALVGGPSNGKSPALETLRRALAAVEKTTAAEKRGPVVLDKPMTLSALLAAAGKRPAGALLWRDEPNRWLAALGCNGRRERVEVSALLDAFAPLRTALGPGSPAISIVGCLDPERLDEALVGSDDGRAARFLYAWPKAPAYRSFLERLALRESDAVNALQRIARAAGDPGTPLALSPSEEALRVFDRHLRELHEALQGCRGVEAAWLGKGRGTVARLATALALLHWSANASSVAPPPRTLDRDTMIAARTLWDYFRQHARAVLGRAFHSAGDRLRRRVLCWIRDRGLAQISREDVRRHALSHTLNAHQSSQLIQSLERAGWLREMTAEPGRNGRPPLRWDVNPVLIGDANAESAESAETRRMTAQGTTPAGSSAQ